MDKRLVFHHAGGPRPGLYQIIGAMPADAVFPSTVEEFEVSGRFIPRAALVRVEQRYALYREGGKQ